jgi:Xaa-Pro dipeptidase
MARENLDAILATTPENVAYLTGFGVEHYYQWRGGRHPVFAILTQDGDCELIVPRGFLDLVAQQHGSDSARLSLFGEFHMTPPSAGASLWDEEAAYMDLVASATLFSDPLDAIIAAFQRLGAQRIGFDDHRLRPAELAALQAVLPGTDWRPAYDTLRQVRMVKTTDEVERLERANHVTADALLGTLALVEPGVGVQVLRDCYASHVAGQQGMPTLMTLAAGPRRAFGSGAASDYRLRAGDILRMDVGCTWAAYHADLCRVISLGPPDAKHRAYYAALLAGHRTAVDMLRPGVAANEVFTAAASAVRAGGIPHFQRHHCGHGIGLEGYDAPLLAPGDSTVLEEGTVVNVEMPYYELGWGGLNVEDTYVVTASGSRRVGSLSQDIFVR